MMNKISKPAFQIILGGFLLVSASIVSCNDGDKKEGTENAPAVSDSPKVNTIDTGNTKPIVPGSRMDTGDTKPIVPGS